MRAANELASMYIHNITLVALVRTRTIRSVQNSLRTDRSYRGINNECVRALFLFPMYFWPFRLCPACTSHDKT